MLLKYSNIFFRLHKKLPNYRFLCTKPPVVDTSAPYRAKPEDIPKGIWQEDNDATYTSVEEVKDRWHYVERLLPKLRIPDPPKKSSAIGWKAPADNIPELPYYIKRSRNHMLPVYERRMYIDRILVTKVGKVHGDIWLFEHDLKTYLEEKLGEKVESNVNEIVCSVNIKGNHVEAIKEWLYNKGF